jgi:hypothetical protein
MSDKENKTSKKSSKKVVATEVPAKNTFKRGILGIVLLLVFGSIAFSTVVIWAGTDTWGPKIMTAPAAIFDLFIAFVAFSKILK